MKCMNRTDRDIKCIKRLSDTVWRFVGKNVWWSQYLDMIKYVQLEEAVATVNKR